MTGYVYITIRKTQVQAGDVVTVTLEEFVGVWRPLR